MVILKNIKSCFQIELNVHICVNIKWKRQIILEASGNDHPFIRCLCDVGRQRIMMGRLLPGWALLRVILNRGKKTHIFRPAIDWIQVDLLNVSSSSDVSFLYHSLLATCFDQALHSTDEPSNFHISI